MSNNEAHRHSTDLSERSLVDGIPVGIYRTSVAGLILDANNALLQISGYPERDRLIGASAAAAYVNPAERSRWQEAMDRDGVVRDFEVQIRRYDGAVIWVKDSARAVRDEHGRFLYYEGILEDITERKQAEEALRRRDAILQALAFTSQKLFVHADLNDTFADILADIGKAVAASRAYIFQNEQTADGAYLTGQRCEWVAGNHLSQADNPALYNVHYERAGFGRWIEPLQAGLPIHGLVETFPAEEQKTLRPQGIVSIAVFPIHVGGQWWGFLGLDDCEQERTWTTVEITALKSTAGVLAGVIGNARLYESERRARERAEVMREVAQIVTASVDRNEILRRSLRQLRRVLTFDMASVYVYGENNRAELVVTPGYPDEALTTGEALSLLEDSPIFNRMLSTLQPVLCADVRRLPGWIWAPGAEAVRSYMAVPLVIRDRMIGALMVDSRHENFFDETDLEMVQTLAQHVAVAVENAHLFELQRTQLRLSQTLQAVGALLTTSLQPEELCEQIFDLLAQVVSYDSASVQLLDRKDKVSLLAARGVDNVQQMRQQTRELEANRLRQRWQGQRVIVVPDTHHGEEWQQASLENHVRSWIGVALTVQDRMMGILNISSNQVNDYNAAVAETVMAFANQAAVAIENARLFAAERRQLRLSQTLQQVGALLTGRLSLNEVFEQILDLLAHVVEYDSVSIQLIDGDETYMAAGRGFPDQALSQKIINQITAPGLKERWGDDKKIIVIPDTHRYSGWNTSAGNEYIRSWIGAALRVKGRLLGIVSVDSATPHAYDTESGEMVWAFANQAAVAIENARLHEETRQRANELAILHQVALATAATVNVDDLIEQTTELIAATLYPDVFGFVLLDSQTGKLQPHPSYQGVPKDALQATIPFESSITGQVARTGQPLLLKDVTREPLYYQVLPTTRSEIAVPLSVKQRVRGVINVESPQLNAFSENDIHFLTTLAGQVGIALERATLYESLQQYTAHLAHEVNRRTAELRAERDRNQAVLDSAGEGIFFTDCDGVILYVNPAMTRLTGYTVAETLGQTPRLWHTLAQSPPVVDSHIQMWAAIQIGRAWSGEMMNRRKDGSIYDAHLTLAPIHSLIGESTGFVGIQSDISRLKEVDRLKSKFVSNVSHELRTPLTNIKTYLTLMQRGKPERKNHYLNVLQHETERLTRLIQDLLDLSRLETEAAPLQLQPTDVHEVTLNLMDAFIVKAESKRIELCLEIPAGLPQVLAEPYRLEQVLTNLVGNALAYTQEGGKVVIRAGAEHKETGAHLWLSVSDNGPGIPAPDLPRLFERFFRGQLAHDRNIPGTGLGLAICKEIIDRHQGTLEVESRPGENTVFTIRLPIVV
jgi:PAS domain S-box-containing protein